MAALLAGCAASPPAPEPVSGPPSAEYHLVMGELALARQRPDVATAEYAAAAGALDDAGVARRAMLIALHAGDRRAAHRAADRWESLAPEDLEAAQYQAMLHARAGETDTALRYLLRIADGSPEDRTATAANLQLITTLLAAEPNRWRAASLMAAVAAARPEYPEGWFGAALLALEADRPAQAIEFADHALAHDPNLLDALFLRARAALSVRPMRTDALAALEGFRNSRDPGLRFRFAGLLVIAGREDEADALYEDILVNAPDQHDARMARALLAMDAGRIEDAEAGLHSLLEHHGRVQDALYYLGVLAEKRGELGDAIDWYARVAPEQQRWLDAQLGIGRVLIRQDGVEAAQEFFTELRAHWPEYAHLLALNEAALLTGNAHPEPALAVLDEFRATVPDAGRADFDWQTGLAAAEAGDAARAEEIFRRMLADDPGNPSVQNALGYLLLDQEARLDEAGRLLEAALAAAPANPAFQDSLGWQRQRQGRSEEARALLEESWDRQPSAITGMHLLTVLLTLGDDAAVAALRKEINARFPGVLEEGGNP